MNDSLGIVENYEYCFDPVLFHAAAAHFGTWKKHGLLVSTAVDRGVTTHYIRLLLVRTRVSVAENRGVATRCIKN